jgi:radical SAM enzyme (TIGR01210 family)
LNPITANSSSPSTIKAPSTSWITAQRPARSAHLDPLKPHAFFLEQERLASGQIADTATILLTNKECPWRCLMCDLWKNTLPKSVPPGAISQQIDFALTELSHAANGWNSSRCDESVRAERTEHPPRQIKLYNSGSFFDSAAIPLTDYSEIAQRLHFAQNIIVESHPRLISDKTTRFRDLLSSPLEVAMGLETIHPQILPRLNKRFSLDQFAAAAAFLEKERIALRAFILVNPPFSNPADAIDWTIRSAQFAFDCGATAVSLIPTRAGNGAMDALLKSGEFTPPRLSDLEKAHDEILSLHRGRVFADTWDLQQFSHCDPCFQKRFERLRGINLTQQSLPRVDCPHCAGA